MNSEPDPDGAPSWARAALAVLVILLAVATLAAIVVVLGLDPTF